jgi:ADP-ribose pyrophosphatase YjhB (NUDIX family)
VEIIPVRRDGTGRLVAVGLIEVSDATGVGRWSLISGSQLPGETLPTVIERCLAENLGSDVRGQSSQSWIEAAGRASRRAGPRSSLHSQASGEQTPTAVEITGRLEPHGVAMRFTWFLVTALPAQAAIRFEHRALLAAFLEAQGEPGLAGRLRQFSR